LRNAILDFKGHDLDELIQRLVIPALNELDWKTALLVSNPIQFGVSRQYQVFEEIYSNDAIFSNTADAKVWLFSQ
jgi:hypothetical protein